MISGIDVANFCIAAIGLTISFSGMLLAMNVNFLEKWLKKYFTIIFAIILAYVVSNFASQISLIFPGKKCAVITQIAIFFESFFSSALIPILAVCIQHLCRQRQKSPLLIANAVLWGIYTVLLVITQFTTSIYYITDDNMYHRGPLYPVLLVPPVLLMITNIIGLYRRKQMLSAQIYHSFLLYLLIPMIATIAQMVLYGLFLIVLGTSISAMLMFLYIINDQIEKNIRQSREIAAQQLTIRTLQMRPHFIYNTLSNIYYLCQQDPNKAQQAIDDFTQYLRKNFSAITKEELIPFEEELEHAKAYLSVVKIRFEEQLFINYDIQFTTFRMPPLTLEPIVENSVKHGLDPDSSPLHITVKTRQIGNSAVITVEDNGSGYDASEAVEIMNGEDNDEHIGLSNVKNRLKSMCKGTLRIGYRNGGGTTVTITIPL